MKSIQQVGAKPDGTHRDSSVQVPQHRLYFFPEPHGQGSLRPTFAVDPETVWRVGGTAPRWRRFQNWSMSMTAAGSKPTALPWISAMRSALPGTSGSPS
jgi:hypothetical protein